MRDVDGSGPDDEVPEPLKQWLRDGLEPDAAAIARVVERATAAPRRRLRSPALALAAAVGVVAIVASAVSLFRSSVAARRAVVSEGATLTITNASGRLEVLGLPPEELPSISNVGDVFCAVLPGEEPRYLVIGGSHENESD
jgi:hypothetical protein